MRDQRPDEQARDVVVECELDAPPERVWRALTEPELLARWLLPNDIRAEAGARFTLQADHETGGAIDCEVLAAEPPRLLSYRWREAKGGVDSVVSFELTDAVAGRTHLRLVHSGFPVDIAAPLTRLVAGSNVVSLAFAAQRRPALAWRNPIALGRAA